MSGLQLADYYSLCTLPIPEGCTRIMHVYNHEGKSVVRALEIDSSVVRVSATNYLGLSAEDLGMLRNYVFTPKTPFEKISSNILFYKDLLSCVDLVSGPDGTDELFLRAVVADVDRTLQSKREYRGDMQLCLRLSLESLMTIKTNFDTNTYAAMEDSADSDAISAYLVKVPDKSAVGDLDFSKRKPVDTFEIGVDYRISPVTFDANGKNGTFEKGVVESHVDLKKCTHATKPPTKEERRKRNREEDEIEEQKKQAVVDVVEGVQHTKFGVSMSFTGRFNLDNVQFYDIDGQQGAFFPFEALKAAEA